MADGQFDSTLSSSSFHDARRLVLDFVERRLELSGVLFHSVFIHHRVVHHDRQTVDEARLGNGLGFLDTWRGHTDLLVGLLGLRDGVRLILAAGKGQRADQHCGEARAAPCTGARAFHECLGRLTIRVLTRPSSRLPQIS